MANTITHIKIGNVDHIIASSAYAICLSPADRVNKEAFIKNDESFHFTLTDGITLHVKFRYTNTASRPTLNINNTGAKALYIYGTTPPGTTIYQSWKDNSMVALTYDEDADAYIINNYFEKLGGSGGGGSYNPADYVNSVTVNITSNPGQAQVWSRGDHTHGLQVSTGDTNGTLKIGGTNFEVKGLAAAAYAQLLTSLVNQSTNTSDAVTPKAVVDYIQDQGYIKSSEMPDIPTAAYSRVSDGSQTISASSLTDILNFKGAGNTTVSLVGNEIVVSSNGGGGGGDTYRYPNLAPSEGGTAQSIVTNGQKYEWSKVFNVSIAASTLTDNTKRLVLSFEPSSNI